MTHLRLRLPLSLRARRRASRRHDDPAEVFRTFVHLLAQMQAHARSPSSTGAEAERG